MHHCTNYSAPAHGAQQFSLWRYEKGIGSLFGALKSKRVRVVLSGTVSGMDAAVELTWTYLQRVQEGIIRTCVNSQHCQIVIMRTAAWRADVNTRRAEKWYSLSLTKTGNLDMPTLPLRTRFQIALATVCYCAFAACVNAAPPETGSAAKIEPCEAIRTLTSSYKTQFSDIRRAKRSYDRINIWSTGYQLVGSGCEIWGWQGGNFNYVCNYVAPNEATAREIYSKARATIRQCLDEHWAMRQEDLPHTQGSQTVFNKPDFAGVIDLRLLQTRGIAKPRWAIYLLIGDYNSQI